MLRNGLIYILIGVIITLIIQANIIFAEANGNDSNLEPVDSNRSAVCLITMLAKIDKIAAVYTLSEKKVENKFVYNLTLGTEPYNGSGLSKKKAEENTARTAYENTKYTKPKLKARTCIISPPVKNDISILHEYAAHINQIINIDEKQISINPKEYEIVIGVNGKTASASSFSKRKAMQEAATRLVDIIGRENLITSLILKYNATVYHEMNPVERLRKINNAGGFDDVKYISTQESNQGNQRRFVVNVVAKNIESTGVGETMEKAKQDGAAKILKNMNFTVTTA